MSERRFLVSFDLASGPLRHDALNSLRAICSSVDAGMREMGVFVCLAPESAVPRLRAIPGVIGVEVEREISIGPPDNGNPQ